MTRRLPVLLGVLGILTFSTSYANGRLYGTLNATYQHNTRDGFARAIDTAGSDSLVAVTTSEDYGQSDLLINYDAMLFTKNTLRLAANVSARQGTGTGKWSVRTIYYLDIRNDGYSYSSSYAPYSQEYEQKRVDNSILRTRVYYRDWRNTLNIAYPKWPTLNATYGSSTTFDRLPVRKLDGSSKSYFLDSYYSYGALAVRGSATQTRAENKVSSPHNISTVRTYNGSTSFAKDFGKAGYLSSSYAYLDTRSEAQSQVLTVGLLSHSHSVTAYYGARSFHGVGASASYSGRFVSNRQAQLRLSTRDESFSGLLSYAPLKFLTFDVTKTYTISTQPEGHRISEYLVLSSTLSRYLRRGVDSRFNWSRTFFQRVDRGSDTTQSPGGYSMDSYYGSLSATPYPHSRVLFDISVSKNNDPAATTQEYLVNRSINLIVSASRRLEGRLGATYIYQGNHLDFFRSYSQNMNIGATYYPGSNLNINVTYLHSVVNTDQSLANGSLNGYVGYAFRQAFSIYLSVNRQLQETPLDSVTGRPEKTSARPYSAKAQIQIRLSPGSNLTIGYLRTGGSGVLTRTGQFQAVYNGQF